MNITNWEASYIQKLEALVLAQGGTLPPINSPFNWQERSLQLLDAIGASLGGAASANYLDKTQNLADLSNPVTARTNLGLGTAATAALEALQPADSDLTAIAALNTQPFGRELLIQSSAAGFVASLSNSLAGGAYTMPTFLNGWSYYIGLGYKKFADNLIMISLAVFHSAPPNGSIVFNLPSGFRPSGSSVSLSFSGFPPSWRQGIAIISVDGNVQLYLNDYSANAYVCLDLVFSI